MKRGLIFCFTLIFIISSISALDLYVDKNNNSGICSDIYTRLQNSIAQPWCTINASNYKHEGGDHIYILPGEYREAIWPKPGIDKDQRTIYSGYTDNSSEVKILGSEELTGWTQCSGAYSHCEGAPDNVWFASLSRFPQLRHNRFNPTYGCVPGSICEQFGERNYSILPTTDCYQNRGEHWYSRADWDGTYFGDGSPTDFNMHPYYVDEAGEYVYNYTSNFVYLRTPNSDNPSNYQIECSVIRTTFWETGYSYSIYAEMPSWFVELDNFLIKNLSIMHSLQDGINLGETSNNMDITNMEISYCAGASSCRKNVAGIIAHKFGSANGYDLPPTDYHYNLSFTNNKIHHMGNDFDGLGSSSRQGIELYKTIGATIANNEIYEVSAGIYSKSDNTRVIIRNNSIHNTGTGVLIQLYNQNNIIEGNVLYNVDQEACIRFQGDVRNNTFIHNICYGGPSFFMNAGARFWDESGPVETTDVFNNVFYDAGIEFFEDNSNINAINMSNYNLFFGGSFNPNWGIEYNTLESWSSGTGFGINSMIEDPMFVSTDPASPDFLRLASGSPAIDNGTKIDGYHCDTSGGTTPEGCRVWYGTAPDIGAFEYLDTGSMGPACTSSGTCWYVDQNNINCGDTSFYGNWTHPFCTIDSANTYHNGGDHIYILPGEYREGFFPKPGTSNSERTIYSGYTDNPEDVKILGSVELTGWTQCSGAYSHCEGALDNVWFSTLSQTPQLRKNNFYGCVPGYFCEAPLDRNYTVMPATDCYQNRGEHWYVRADYLNGNFGMRSWDYSMHPYYVDEPGEYVYNYTSDVVYLRTPDDTDPNTKQIECSVIRPAPWVMGYLSDYAPAGYQDPYNIVVKNLSVMHSLQNGITLGETGDNIEITNTEISYSAGPSASRSNVAAIIAHRYGNAGWSILSTFHKNISITNNKIHHIGNDFDGLGSSSRQGIEFYHTNGGVIANNEIYEVSAGIYLKSSNNGTTVYNNTIHDAGGGIQIQQYDQNHLIKENILYNIGNDLCFFISDSHSRDNIIVNNLCYNAARGLGFTGSDGDVYNYIIANNIFANIAGNDYVCSLQGVNCPDIFTILDYNLFDDPITGDYLGGDSNSIVTDPQFISTDPASSDFLRPALGSPAIDNGTIISGVHCTQAGVETFPGCRMWYGTAPDIGAFEYVDLSSCTLTYDVEPCDCINDVELQNAINAWFAGTLSTSNLYSHFQVWKTSSGC